jgi:hypothetical protein
MVRADRDRPRVRAALVSHANVEVSRAPHGRLDVISRITGLLISVVGILEYRHPQILRRPVVVEEQLVPEQIVAGERAVSTVAPVVDVPVHGEAPRSPEGAAVVRPREFGAWIPATVAWAKAFAFSHRKGPTNHE